MSKIFYDHLIIIEEVENELDKLELSSEERLEIEQLIDETVHHRILNRILTVLPKAHHQEFLEKFHLAPYDQGLIDYINQRIDERIEIHIKDEAQKLKKEILEDIKLSKPQKK